MNVSIGADLALSFTLLFVRAAALTIVLPRILGVSVPARVNLLLAVLLAGSLMPAARLSAPAAGDVLAVAMMAMREVAIGIGISFAAAIVVGAVSVVGEVVGNSMELSDGAILRGAELMPNVLADSLSTLAGLLFFIAGFHRAMLLALSRSLTVAPLGGFAMPDAAAMIALGGRVFALALEIGLPLMIPLFVLSITQGVIARLAPQINILIAAPSAIALAGLTILGLDAAGLESRILRAWSEVIAQGLRWVNG